MWPVRLPGLAIAVVCACGSSPTSPPSKSSASSAQPTAQPVTQPSSGPQDEARALRDKILRVNQPVIIMKNAATFAEYREVVRTAESIEGVVAAAPIVFLELHIASAGHAPRGVAVKGIDPRRAGGMRDLGPALKTGKLMDLAQGDPPALILGDQLAELLGVHTGDRVVVTHPPQTQPAGKPPREYPFRVTGIMHTEIDVYDDYLAFASLAAAQQIADRGDQVMGVEVKVKDIDRSDEVARAIERALGGRPYVVMDWFELNRELFGGRRP
jgi:lipoprotein-releasing system permease protein